MKIIKKIILIVIPLLILGNFIVYWIEPNFSLWQMNKSIVYKKQSLPLMIMFLPSHQNGQFFVKGTQPQFVLAGPKLTLFYGTYTYKLKIVPDCSGKDLGFMDVVRSNGNHGLGAKEIITKDAGVEQIESISFNANNASDYEFRLSTRGECQFEVKDAWIERDKTDYRMFLGELWQKTKKIVL